MMSKERIFTVALLLCQAWSSCQATEEIFSYKSQYISSFMKVDSSGGIVTINPKTSELESSDYTIKIQPSTIEVKSGSLVALSTKEFSFKDEVMYDGIPANTVTIYSGLKDGKISITYTMFKKNAVNQTYPSTGDLWIDIEVINICNPCTKETPLDVSMTIEVETGVFQNVTNEMFDADIVTSDWSNFAIPLELYSTNHALLDGVKTKIEVSAVNTTSKKITYTIHPEFKETMYFSAIWLNFPRAMPSKSDACSAYPCFHPQFVLLILGFVKFFI